MCKTCHQEETDNIQKSCELIIRAMKEKFLACEITDLACKIHFLDLSYPSEVTMAIICFVLENKKLKDQIVSKYFKFLEKSKPQKNALDE